MKLTIDLPDWCDERHIYIMAGIEMAAYKLYGEDVVNIKTVRCAACGSCCRNLSRYLPDVAERGDCIHLGTRGIDNECGLSEQRPFLCSTGMQHKGLTPKCSIEYRTEKL